MEIKGLATGANAKPRATAIVQLKFKTVSEGEDVLEADGRSFEWLMGEQ